MSSTNVTQTDEAAAPAYIQGACRQARRSHWHRKCLVSLLALALGAGLHVSTRETPFLLALQAARANNIQYIYDALGRLVQATDLTSGQTIQYTYDSVGNITSQSVISTATLSVGSESTPRGPVGGQVTINGTGFSTNPGSNLVSFNGTPATVVSATPTQLVVIVPGGATSGPITVQVGTNTVTANGTFTVSASAPGPAITALVPATGTAGTAVTLLGTNFAATPADDSVQFNQSQAVVTAATTTSITALVPTGTGSGKVQVTTPTGTAVSPVDFIVAPGTYSIGSIGSTGRIATNGSPVTLSLPTAHLISVQLFDANAGNLLAIGVSSMSLASATLTVLNPNNTVLTSGTVTASGQGLQIPVLPSTGTYTLVVDPGANTGSIAVGITGPITGTLTLNGAPTPLSLTPPGERALLTFAGTQGTYAAVALTGVTLSAGTVSLIAPNGAVLDTEAFGTSGASLPSYLPQSGTYSVLISPTGSIGGALNAAVTTSSTPNLAIGQSFPLNLSGTTPSSATFDATANQYLTLAASETGLSGVTITVLNPDGTTLTSGSMTASACGGTNTSCAFNLGPLPFGGTYKVVAQQTGTGSGTLTLTLSSPVMAALTIGSAAGVTASIPGQAMQLTLTGSAGQFLSLGVAEQEWGEITGATVTVLSPDGSMLGTSQFAPNYCGGFGCSGYSGAAVINIGPLLMDGTHTILVQQANAGSGTLIFTPSAPVTQTLTPGTSTAVDAALQGQAMQLSFSGAAGQYLALGIAENLDWIGGAAITAFNPDGSVLSTGVLSTTICFSSCANGTGATGSSVVNMGPLPVAGTYTVLIQQTSLNIPNTPSTSVATGTLTLSLSNPVSDTLSIGATANETATLAGQPYELSFSGTAGQYLGVGSSGGAVQRYPGRESGDRRHRRSADQGREPRRVSPRLGLLYGDTCRMRIHDMQRLLRLQRREYGPAALNGDVQDSDPTDHGRFGHVESHSFESSDRVAARRCRFERVHYASWTGDAADVHRIAWAIFCARGDGGPMG